MYAVFNITVDFQKSILKVCFKSYCKYRSLITNMLLF